MAEIRPETEVDRTQQALAARELDLPLRRGAVEVAVGADAASSPVGQKLITVLVNELARMKGVVSQVHVVGIDHVESAPNVPVRDRSFAAGLESLVDGLNSGKSKFHATIAFEACPAPTARIRVGRAPGEGLKVGADAWRALIGDWSDLANWDARSPFGAALVAAIAAAEAFKLIVAANGGREADRRFVSNMAFSALDYGVNEAAGQGPDLPALALEDMAVAGCGAGGTSCLYVLAMQPALEGTVALIEPGAHKLSNLNRYLMSTAADVYEPRHKLGSVANHLALFAPRLKPTLMPVAWEMLDQHPWKLVLSTVDTVEARWNIQRRRHADAEILDGAVNDLLYVALRVAPGGRCLECTHPYDPELPVKQRAGRWGVGVDTIRQWTAQDVIVSREMVERLVRTQNRLFSDYEELVGQRFSDIPQLTECGETKLRADVPSQAPVLPISTTAVGVVLAAEVAKYFAVKDSQLSNWLGHDLARNPEGPRAVFRGPIASCPHHKSDTSDLSGHAIAEG